MIEAWLAATPYALAFGAILWTPGLVVLWPLGVRGLTGWALAPAVTAGLVGAAAVAAAWLGVGWGFASFFAFTALVVVAAAVVGRRGATPRSRADTRSGGDWAQAPLIWLGLGSGAVLHLLVLVPGIADPALPLQNRDAVFHMNAVQAILEGGNASSLGGLAAMYGDGSAPYYPAVWHAIVALVASPTTVALASNAFSVVVSVLVWPLGLAALAAVAAPRARWAAPVVPVFAAGFAVFPAAVMFFHGQWPFGLSIALTPAVVAAVALAVQRGDVRTWLGIAPAAFGMLAAHPSGAGVLGVVAVALWASWLLDRWFGAHRGGAHIRGIGWAALLLGSVSVLAVAALAISSRLAMASFERPGGSRLEGVLEAGLLETLVPYEWITPEANLALVALLGIGLLAAAASRGRWVGLAWLAFVALNGLAAGTEGRLRVLTALWYKDEVRVRAVVVTFAVILCAIGLDALVRALSSRAPRRTAVEGVLAVGLVGAVVLSSGLMHRVIRHDQWVAAGYHPQYMAAPPLADGTEIDFIESLEDLLPDGAVVVGDPLSGAVLVQVLTSHQSFIPVIGASGTGPGQQYLMQHFVDLPTDPMVCDLLEEAGAREGRVFLYWDTPEAVFLGAVPAGPGFATPPPSGVELVAESEDVTVWRVTACADGG